MKKLLIILFTVFIFITANSQNSNLIDLSYHPDYNSKLAPFYHGLASGDALHDKVIIWTRITPYYIYSDTLEVNWYISDDSLFQNNVKSGKYLTTKEKDFTVKVDVVGLKSDVWHYYCFEFEGKKSIVGRTKTTPVKKIENKSIRLAIFSGSNYNAGYFNAYNCVGQRDDIDAVLHLGDYIYEYGTNDYGKNKNRELFPDKELLTLQDYRQRYSHYRLDVDLQLAHQRFPWYIVWDDHEIANNSWTGGASNHNQGEGEWERRKQNGKQAFY